MPIIAKIKNYTRNHKIISGVGLIIILVGGYMIYKAHAASGTETRYVLGTVERGTLVVSVSGSGQVATSNKIDIKPKAAGQITSVKVVKGQTVKTGDIIAQVDSRDAVQAVRDAAAALASAKISLQKTQTSSTQTVSKAQDSLTKSYDSGYNTMSSLFVDFPKVFDDIDSILNNWSSYMSDDQVRATSGNAGVERKNKIVSDVAKTKDAYDKLFDTYKGMTRQSDPQQIESVLSSSYDIAKQFGDNVKDLRAFITFLEGSVSSVTSQLTSDKNTINTDSSTVNSKITDLFSAETDIQNAKNDLASAQESYGSISGGISSGTLDVQTAQLNVVQKQNAYQKALDTLSDYTVRAPFDGVVAALNVQKGDDASSGTSLATLVTQQQIATLSLNEVDVAKVKLGQKATLTFDAIDGLSITGEVIDIDTIGTVSQGVVSYAVKVGFDTQDERIKSGMTVTAALITDTKANALIVPSSAVKSNGNGSYVEVLDSVSSSTPRTSSAVGQQGVTSVVPPRQVPVEVGLSNDSETEITSGLNEGDSIITRTITGSQTTTQTRTATSLLGGNRGGATGGAARNVRFGG